jgi:hypothetical protein
MWISYVAGTLAWILAASLLLECPRTTSTYVGWIGGSLVAAMFNLFALVRARRVGYRE